MTGENEIEQEKSGQTRLEAFEKMLSAVQQNYQDTLDKMEQLKNLFFIHKNLHRPGGFRLSFPMRYGTINVLWRGLERAWEAGWKKAECCLLAEEKLTF